MKKKKLSHFDISSIIDINHFHKLKYISVDTLVLCCRLTGEPTLSFLFCDSLMFGLAELESLQGPHSIGNINVCAGT